MEETYKIDNRIEEDKDNFSREGSCWRVGKAKACEVLEVSVLYTAIYYQYAIQPTFINEQCYIQQRIQNRIAFIEIE